MKGKLFSHEIGKTSTVFGRKHDVRVVFQGDGAATDGGTIILPSLDHNSDVNEAEADIMRGYVDHEAGHVRHTDFNALGEFAKASDGNQLVRSVHNALEDIWLERRVMDEYPGAAENLKAVSTAVNSEFLNEITADDPRLQDDVFITAVALTWEGRKDYGGDSNQQCIDLLPDDIQRQLPLWVAALDGCKDTADVITLAKIVEKEIRDGDYKDERKEGDKPESGKGSGGDGDGDGDGAGDNPDNERGGDETQPVSGDDGSGEDTGGQPAGSEGEDQPEEGGTVGSGSDDVAPDSGTTSDDVYTNFDVGEIVRGKIASNDKIAGNTHGSYTPLSTAHDEWHTRKGKTRLSRHLRNQSARDYDKALSVMNGQVNVMRRKLERALSAKMARDWDYGKEDGRLDNKRLVGAFNGSRTVFKEREDRREIDTAFTVLIDLSGSMRGSKAKVAQQCAMALAEAVDKTGVAYEVLGFNNTRPMPREARLYTKDEHLYARQDPIDMWVFKAFHERLFEAKGAMASIAGCAMGCNSDGECVEQAYERLIARPEKRKVMMVLSDGQPACNGHSQRQYLRQVIEKISKDGTDLVGIGILTDAVEQFYPKYTVVESVEDLAGSAMDQLSRILLGERFQIDNSKLMAVS